MKLPQEMEGRRACILLDGISTVEVKILKITEEELIATYNDGEEVHIATEYLRAWWPDRRKIRKKRTKKDSSCSNTM